MHAGVRLFRCQVCAFVPLSENHQFFFQFMLRPTDNKQRCCRLLYRQVMSDLDVRVGGECVLSCFVLCLVELGGGGGSAVLVSAVPLVSVLPSLRRTSIHPCATDSIRSSSLILPFSSGTTTILLLTLRQMTWNFSDEQMLCGLETRLVRGLLSLFRFGYCLSILVSISSVIHPSPGCCCFVDDDAFFLSFRKRTRIGARKEARVPSTGA